MTVALLTVFFLILATVFYVMVSPFFEKSSTAPARAHFLDTYKTLFDERERLLLNLNDLELDHNEGKIATVDYDELKIDLLSRASKVYEQIETLEKTEPFFQQVENDLKKASAA